MDNVQSHVIGYLQLGWRGMFNGCLGNLMWSAIPYAILWHIWNERNCRIFNGKEKSWRYILLDIKLAIIAWARRSGGIPYPVGAILRQWQIVVMEKKKPSQISPRWEPPPAGWFKLNFDGSALGNPVKAGTGGIIGNSEGQSIMTFSGPAGICDANEAEAKALLAGLKWYASHNLGPLIILGDSSKAIGWAKNLGGGPWHIHQILDEIQDLARKSHPSLKHRRRTANSAVDALAKDGAIYLKPDSYS
ncbi:uncharacterized protein LOC143878104 [Tasmannia lanceolata]|uniref:uncharacterized protein LOC143878104 n=1 Tax=Tasmannia lanceolata TaxID=3420 RepID=UPI0040630EB2